MAFTAGQKVRASELNAQGVLLARGRRTTNSGGSTSAVVPLLRLDDVAVAAGRAYLIEINGGLFPSGADTARADVTLRFTTTGATPTTGSPVLLLDGKQMFTAGFVERYNASIVYVPGSNQLLSLLLCFQSVIYGANVSSYGTSSWPTEILITDLGADPGNVGTVI